MTKIFHRRNLPHLHFSEGRYFVTYRLANSIPHDKLDQLKIYSSDWDFDKFYNAFSKYDSLIDSGEYGINYLNNKEAADICKTTLHYPDNKEYKLICYCIMQNHVHLVFELLPQNKGISKIMQAIKGISSNRCNLLFGREGQFWQDESFDRWIRDDTNFTLLFGMFY